MNTPTDRDLDYIAAILDHCCTIRINGKPVSYERYKRFAPTVRYPFPPVIVFFIHSDFYLTGAFYLAVNSSKHQLTAK